VRITFNVLIAEPVILILDTTIETEVIECVRIGEILVIVARSRWERQH